MEEITVILIPAGFIFTLLMFWAPRLNMISGMVALTLWFPLAAVVATESSPTNTFWVFFFGLGWLCFAWVAILVVEGLTGRIIIGRT